MSEAVRKYLEVNNINVMLWGLPACGKTMLATTFPRYGKPLVVDVFDPQGAAKYRRYVPEGELMLDYWPVEGSLALPSHGKRPGKNTRTTVVDDIAPKVKGEIYVKWAEAFHKKLDDGVFAGAAAYVVDSLSYFSIAALERQLHLAGKAGSLPDGDAGDYDALKMGQRRAFAMMAIVPCPTVFLCHEVVRANYEGGEKLHELNVVGTVRAELPAACNEIYHLRGLTTGSRTVYEAQTGPAGNWEMCRTEIGDLGKLKLREDVTIDPKQPFETQGLAQLFEKALNVEG